MLTLTQFDAGDTCVSVTEHATLSEALAEHAGWTSHGAAVRYMVQGTMTLDCACKRVMESRNRDVSITLRSTGLSVYTDSTDTESVFFTLDVKAPQACKMMQQMQKSSRENYGTSETHEGIRTEPLIDVCVTNTEFRIG